MRKRILQYIRKGIAIILVLSSLLPTQGIYAAEKDSEILFVESFDGCVTNSLDASVSIIGDPNARVIDEGNENKVLFLPNEDYNAVKAPIGKYDADCIVFSMKVKFANKAVPFKVSIKNGSTSFTPMNISENGVVAHDGKKIGGVAKDVWNRFDIVYNIELKRYSVYINGSCKLYMYLYNKMSAITEMLLEFEGEEESLVYLDDVAVYTGDSPDDSIMGEAYNPESTEFIEKEDAASMTVFVNNDFNKKNSLLNGIDAVASGNVWEYAEEKDGNGYLFLNKTVDNTDPYFDAAIACDATMKGVVFSADFSVKGNAPTARIFSARAGNAWLHILSTTPTGEIRANGVTVAKMKKNQWVNVTLVLNFRRKAYDVYCDGELIIKKAAFPNSSFEKMGSMRTQALPSVGVATLMIDNLKIYESDVPMELGEEIVEQKVSKTDIFPKDSEYTSRLKDTVALHLGSDWMFAKTKKKKMDAVPYVSNDRTMIPIRAVTEAFGLEVAWDGNESLITLDGRIKMKVGEKTMTSGGRNIELDTAPEIKDGRTYIPVRALAEQALGKKVFYCDYGLIVISDNDFKYSNENELIRLSTYVFSERPDEDAIKQAFDNFGYKNVHPRLHADADDFARLREEYKTNKRIKEWTDNIIRLADNTLKQPPTVIPANPEFILMESRAIQDRLLNLGYAYQITKEKKYAKRAWEEMEVACSLPSWNPKHFLDTGEMAYAVAIGYDWCYDYLNEEQRSIAEEAIAKLGLLEGIKQYTGKPTGTNFVFQNMNWNTVCNGGLSAAALAILDVKPEEALYTINRALRSFEYMMTEFVPDGGWIEGPMYWGYMMKYLCIWMDCMKSTLGTDYNIPNYPGISKTGEAIFALQGNEGANNYNDSGEGDLMSVELMWLGKYFKNYGLTAAYLSYMELRNKPGTVYECLYYDRSVSDGAIDMPLDNVTRRVETGAMRSNWDTLDGTYLSYRGGKTRVNHYHASQGAFVFDALGVRWAIDLGSDNLTYDSNSMGARNSVYRIRPEGHNCVVINPSEGLGQNMDANCPIIKSESKPKGAYQVLDLSSAYDSETSEYLRGYMLTDDRRSAVIRDEFTLLDTSEAYWFMHTRANIEIVSKDTAILTRNGKRMQFKMIVEGADAELTVMPAEPLPTSPTLANQASNKGVNKIAIHMRGRGKVSVSVRMTPADAYTADEAFVCDEIAKWAIPDGEIGEIPVAKKILVDGEELPSFNPQQPYYTINVFSDKLPEVIVDGGEYKTEYLSKAQDIKGITAVKVSDNEGRYTTYRIYYKTLPILAPVKDRNRLSPVSVYASANPQSDNMDYQAVDENLETLWTATDIQTLTCDFGQLVTVDGFGVAAMKGMTRQYYFEIQVSEDGKSFTTVYDGATAGGTNDYEIFSIEPVKARYVQYVGKKNTENNWNSIAEFAVFGQRE